METVTHFIFLGPKITGCESWTIKKAEELMLLNYGAGEDS